MDKLTISRILVENKYLLPVTKADTGVHVVDIPKAAEVLNELFKKKLKQCNVIGSFTMQDLLLYYSEKEGLDFNSKIVDVINCMVNDR